MFIVFRLERDEKILRIPIMSYAWFQKDVYDVSDMYGVIKFVSDFFHANSWYFAI